MSPIRKFSGLVARAWGIWFVAVVPLGLGCTPGPTRVESYWGATIHRMPRGATYDWAIVDDAAASPKNHDVDQLIRGRIDQILDKMGYRKHGGTDRPDFLVSYRAGSGLQPSSSGQQQRMAMLTIEAISPDGRLIWRGSAEGVVDPSLTPEERSKRVKRAIRLILKPFKPA